jgi:hypothetical protein
MLYAILANNPSFSNMAIIQYTKTYFSNTEEIAESAYLQFKKKLLFFKIFASRLLPLYFFEFIYADVVFRR